MLTLWNPLSGLGTWSQEIDRFFGGELKEMEPVFSPEVDIEEHDDRFVIRADLPGVNESDIEIHVEQGTLVLSGKRETNKDQKSDRARYRERSTGSFRRSFTLGDSIDAEHIEAKMVQGVLNILLPKKEQEKPRRIPVTNN